MVTLDFDQTQPVRGVFGQQRANQRRLAGATGAPQQHVVGRQSIDELTRVGGQQIALAINADQISQTQIQTDFQRCQIAAASITLPARRKGTIPIDDRWLGR